MMAVFDLSFGIAVWIALAIHAVGVEIYVSIALQFFDVKVGICRC
jgi:hypothetical protein